MIEWALITTGARPVPRPAATPLVRAAAFGGALLLVALLNTLVGIDRPELALPALSCWPLCWACSHASQPPPARPSCAG